MRGKKAHQVISASLGWTENVFIRGVSITSNTGISGGSAAPPERHRSWCAAMGDGATGSFAWQSGEVERSPTLHGPEAGDSFVPDVAPRMDLRATGTFSSDAEQPGNPHCVQ